MPLPKFEVSQPANILRIFERGGKGRSPRSASPTRSAPPGRPESRLSDRGLGHREPDRPGLHRPGQKTRLLDPTLNFLGTNDHAGDYRSSGCSACHVMYANDRSPVHSGPFAKYGNGGTSFSVDPTIPKNEPGHPIEHKFITAPPSSQCITCHTHPGTTVMNSYLGFMWWDEETDGELMYPKKQKQPDRRAVRPGRDATTPTRPRPGGTGPTRRSWPRPTDLNPYLKHTQFADFHGHGWVYRGVFKKDRHGNLLDAAGDIVARARHPEARSTAMVPPTDKERVEGKEDRKGTPLHLMDIHLEKGMHCVDCHFIVSAHGNGKLYGEVRNAIEIECIDCHGTAAQAADPPDLRQRLARGRPEPLGPADPLRQEAVREAGQRPDPELDGRPQARPGRSSRRSTPSTRPAGTTTRSRGWPRPSGSTPTARWPGATCPGAPTARPIEDACAHADSNMSCIACHSSWNPSCYGCHLPQKANMKMPELHNAGDVSRNYVSYNFQTLRDDVFMLARDGDVTKNRINPARSSCAIHVGSYNANRESIYVQQQTVSAEGLSRDRLQHQRPAHRPGRPGAATPKTGRSLNPNTYLPGPERDQAVHRLPHLEGQRQQRDHGPAHDAGDQLPQPHRPLLLGRRRRGGAARRRRHRARRAPDRHRQHACTRPPSPTTSRSSRRRAGCSRTSTSTSAIDIGDLARAASLREKPEILGVQTRGEYAYAACGERGLKVFDIAFIDHKGFSERITTAPVSPLGQRFYVKTAYATAVASPTTARPRPDPDPQAREPRAADPRDVRLPLRRRQVRGADHRRRRRRSSTATR